MCPIVSVSVGVSAPNFVQKFGGKYMAHIGEVLEKGLQLSGTSKTKAAEILGVSRQTIYEWIETPNLDQSKLAILGKSIDFDFVKLLGKYADKDVFDYVAAKATEKVEEAMPSYSKKATFTLNIEIDHENLGKIPQDFEKRLNDLLRSGKL